MSEEVNSNIAPTPNPVNTPSNNPVNTLNQVPIAPDKPKEKNNKLGWGVVIGLAALWIILIIVYFMIPAKSSKQVELLKPVSNTTSSITPQVTMEPTLSSSDEPESLANDLNNTNVENLDTELGTVEKELNTP